MRRAKLTSKGQITVPKAIREYLKLHTGDQLQFIIDRTGRVVLTAQTVDVRELFGIVKRKSKRKATIEDFDKAIGNAVKRRYLRASHRH